MLESDTLNTSLSDLNETMEDEPPNVPSLDEKVSFLDVKVNEILNILKTGAVETNRHKHFATGEFVTKVTSERM